MRALFDTNILIDYLNGIAVAKAEVERYERPAISVISWIEVLVGAKAGLEAATRKFVSSFERIELTERIADKAVLIRRGAKISVRTRSFLRAHKSKTWCLSPAIRRISRRMLQASACRIDFSRYVAVARSEPSDRT